MTDADNELHFKEMSEAFEAEKLEECENELVEIYPCCNNGKCEEYHKRTCRTPIKVKRKDLKDYNY